MAGIARRRASAYALLAATGVLSVEGSFGSSCQPPAEPAENPDDGKATTDDFGLSGDWGGARARLAESGVTVDAALTHVFQGNAAGGTDDDLSTAGRFDLGVEFDTTQAGWWDGGLFVLQAQARYGTDQNGRTGSLSAVDYVTVYPIPDEDTVLLSELYYEHTLADWITVSAGRFSLRDSNEFAHDETEQFLNAAFNYNLVTGTTVPSVTLGAAVYLDPTEWLSISTYALDSEGTADASGFDTAFERGTSLLQEFEFAVTIGGMPGHQRVGWTWSDAEKVSFTQNPRDLARAIISGDTSGLARQSSDWSIYYDFDQYLVMADEEHGFGLFGRLGVGDDDVNATAWLASVGLGGRGLGGARPGDSYGLGVYYAGLSNDLPAAVRDRTRDEIGMEAYYAIEATPWLYITPDVQVVRPARDDVDTTVVLGVRLRAVF